ncbi:MAG: flagellin [Phycisphaerales bacterium]|nr:flagellin [Phycisphaerales bacterium]
MSRINTNVTSLIAQRILGNNNQSLTTSLERLSTGLKISRGKDEPAGLIASEALRAEARGLGQAVANAERADQVANIAEGGLQEVSGLLTELQGLVTQTANTAGLSAAEKQANQLQIDSILQTIDRVASATSFQGIKLLNGNFDYTVDAVDGDVAAFRVNGAKLTYQGTRDVNVQVTQSAQTGALLLSFGGTQLDLAGAGTDDPAARFVIEIGGVGGSRELSFSSGTTLAQIVDTINTFTDVTGVSATLSAAGNTGIRLSSTAYGSNEFVSVKVTNDGGVVGDGVLNYTAGQNYLADGASAVAFTAASNRITDSGQDLGATINGINATTVGKVARISTDFLDVEIELSTDASEALNPISAFTITGGGADFQLAGNVDIGGKVAIGIGNVAVREIGRYSSNGSNYTLSNLGAGSSLNVVDGDLSKAQEVVSKAISDISSLRGRLGAFQKNTVGATIRSLGVSLENTVAAESIIRDADFAVETANLTRSQILVSSATQVLSLSNAQPQNVLSLLG